MKSVIVLLGGATMLVAGTADAQTRRPAAKAAARPAPAKPAPKASVYYDFKGARLGMTRAEWREVTPPIETSMTTGKAPVRIWCSDDKLPDGKPAQSVYGKVDTALGIVACSYGQLNGIGTYQYISQAWVKVGDYGTSDATFKFLDDKLVEISIGGHKNLLSEVLEGLSAKFGPSDVTVNDTTQNKMGATFPHIEKKWVNPVATISVEAPYTKIDNMNVTFQTTDYTARWVAKDKEISPAASKM